VLYGEKLICELGEGDELVALTLVGDFSRIVQSY